MPKSMLVSDIEQLLARKSEGKNLDYKEKLDWSQASNDDKAQLVKDMLAMANTQDGGRIVIGVRDSDCETVGLSETEVASMDPTKINDFLHKYADPKFSCAVYKHTTPAGKRLAVIDVPEFQEVPIICKADANSTQPGGKSILRAGQLYVRTEKATSQAISSAQEMRELLGRGLAKRGDDLLSSIERLIKGRPSRPSDEAMGRYGQEIKEAETFLEEKIGEGLRQLGSWTVCMYPNDYNPTRVENHKALRELVTKAEVNLRGWNFPHTDSHGGATNFGKGCQSYTLWERYREGYRASFSGLFLWRRAFWEDVEGHQSGGKPVLSFISVIYAVTEYLVFCRRYFQEMAPNSDIHIEIRLKGLKSRQLVSLDPMIPIWNDYRSEEDEIGFQENVSVVELQASSKEIANRMARHIFAIFNWSDADEGMVDDWQKKLLERRL